MVYVSDHYRPELHYMRGPGPQWLAARWGAGVIPSERPNYLKNPTLIRRIELNLRRWLPARRRARRAHEVQCDLSDRLGPWAV